MKVTPTAIADVLVFEPLVHGDERGFFYERAFSKTKCNTFSCKVPPWRKSTNI